MGTLPRGKAVFMCSAISKALGENHGCPEMADSEGFLIDGHGIDRKLVEQMMAYIEQFNFRADYKEQHITTDQARSSNLEDWLKLYATIHAFGIKPIFTGNEVRTAILAHITNGSVSKDRFKLVHTYAKFDRALWSEFFHMYGKVKWSVWPPQEDEEFEEYPRSVDLGRMMVAIEWEEHNKMW